MFKTQRILEQILRALCASSDPAERQALVEAYNSLERQSLYGRTVNFLATLFVGTALVAVVWLHGRLHTIDGIVAFVSFAAMLAFELRRIKLERAAKSCPDGVPMTASRESQRTTQTVAR